MWQRLGAIGDIHGQSFLLETALNFLTTKVDQILAVGDIVDGDGNVDHCCDLLQSYQVITIMGNHERWFLNQELRHLKNATQLSDLQTHCYEYLANLPPILEIETPHGLLLLCHGVGTDDMNKLNPDDEGYALESNFTLQELINSGKYQLMINGHTHLRMVRKFHHLTVINAGSLKGKYEEKPCFLIIDFLKKIVEFYEFAEENVNLAQSIPF
jgi:predicted phosphodiesterase